MNLTPTNNPTVVELGESVQVPEQSTGWAKHFRVIRSEDVNWAPFPAFPLQARLAILVGEPSKPGPYLIRVHLPANVKMMPHRHVEDRIYTVISGIFYIGLGDCFEASKLTAHRPGSVIVLPGGQPHFHWALSGDYVTQVSATGPMGFEYVDPADDPRRLVRE